MRNNHSFAVNSAIIMLHNHNNININTRRIEGQSVKYMVGKESSERHQNWKSIMVSKTEKVGKHKYSILEIGRQMPKGKK